MAPPTELGPGEFAAALPELIEIYVTAMGYAPETGRVRMPLWLEHSRRPGFRCVVAHADLPTAVAYDVARVGTPTATPAAGDTSGSRAAARAGSGGDAGSGDAGSGGAGSGGDPGPVGDAGGGGPARAASSARSGGAGSTSADRGIIAGFGYGYRGAPGQWWFGEVARGLGGVESPWLRDYFELTELHVRPDRQGAGMGETLLRALLAPVRARTVLLSTPEGENRAWRLYRRTGFVDVLRGFRFTGDSRPFAVLGRQLPIEPATATAFPATAS